jgi:hypothetical protein
MNQLAGEDELELVMARLLRERRSLLDNDAARRFAEIAIAGNSRVSPIEQLEIYRRQFWLRHTDSLVDDFPGVGRILGQAQWERLVEEYLVAHPPGSPSLRELGEQLAAFVESRSWLETRALAADMARLEWALIEAFDTPAHAPLNPERLAQIPEHAWGAARFVPHPTLRLVSARYPVLELLRAAVAAEKNGIPALDPLSGAPETPSFIAVYRKDLVVRREELTRLQYALLARLSRGEALESTCEAAAAELGLTLEELAPHLAGSFQEWAARGYFVGVLSDTI